MASKITDYPAKTAFDDGDLLDVSSFDGVSVYTSEKMTYSQLKTNLGLFYSADGSLTSARTVTLSATNTLTFDGGLTTFKGQNSSGSNYSLKANDLLSTYQLSFANDGVFQTGFSDSSNYLKQETQRTVQYSNTASITGFIADRNGTKAALRSSSSSFRSYLQFTTHLEINRFDGSETGAGVVDTYMRFDSNDSIYFGNQNDSGATGMKLYLASLGDATSTATQKNSVPLYFRSRLWNGSFSEQKDFSAQSVANTGVDGESSLDFGYDGTKLFGIRNDGVILMTSLPTSSAGLPTGALWNNSGVLNIV